jgi:hypothetical protein
LDYPDLLENRTCYDLGPCSMITAGL